MGTVLPRTAENVYLACNASALTVNKLARSVPRDHVDIGAYDRQMGDKDIPNPLQTAHQLLGMYLMGAGEFLYSIAKLVALDSSILMSPAALARSLMEYSSRAWWIAEAPTPEIRILRGHALIRSGYQDAKSTGIEDIPGGKNIDQRLNSWRARKSGLPKVSTPKVKNLIRDMLGDDGAHSYAALSETAHGNALQLIVTVVGAEKGHPITIESVLAESLHANMVALIATRRAAELWGVELEDLEHCLLMCDLLMKEDDQPADV